MTNQDKLRELTLNELVAKERALDHLLRSSEWVKERITELESELEDLYDRRSTLHGYGFRRGSGSIKQTRQEVEQLKQKLADLNLPSVCWVEDPTLNKQFFKPEEWVISRVTPKRIYIKRVGGVEEFYNKATGQKDGREGHSFYPPIDAPGCIEIFETYKESLND